MARSSTQKPPPLDPDVFTAVRTDPQHVTCKICPGRGCKKPFIRRCHVVDHIQSKKHQKNLREAIKQKEQDIPLKVGTLECHQSAFSLPMETPASDIFAIVPDGLPSPPPFDTNSGNPEVPFGQAWDEFEAERTLYVDDYFDEIRRMIENGESIFPTMLPPLEEELGAKANAARYLRQAVTLAGLGTSTFENAIETSTSPVVAFQRGVDPKNFLSCLASDQYDHLEENQVMYYKLNDECRKFELYDPSIFRIGDFVEANFSVFAFPIDKDICGMRLVLRTLALLDGGQSTRAEIRRKAATHVEPINEASGSAPIIRKRTYYSEDESEAVSRNLKRMSTK
ncbi:hypothetical protein L210DRAFT_3653314 [Boletus edulis BED1]|uniref:Uncharacterized protein n=1 Tax=Boletus edulis BED1 TaxID=1328754 RepID=A0AAD4BFK4_BOLED|nr:hypothetical protein L210DRAFT_3653314 [Boletus edulis BED1]